MRLGGRNGWALLALGLLGMVGLRMGWGRSSGSPSARWVWSLMRPIEVSAEPEQTIEVRFDYRKLKPLRTETR